MTDPPTAELAEALEARADQDERFERYIVDNGGAVSTRAKERTTLDRASALRLREQEARIKEMEEALDDLLMAYVGPTFEMEDRLTAVIIKHSLQPEHAQARIAAREKSK